MCIFKYGNKCIVLDDKCKHECENCKVLKEAIDFLKEIREHENDVYDM